MAYSISSVCIGCAICAKSCPVGAIEGMLKQQHVVNAKRCIDCGVCGRVCPKTAVLDPMGSTAEKVDKKLWFKPRVIREACSACSICVDICKKKCINISMPQNQYDIEVYALLLHSDRCVSCGMCADFCPQQAIIMEAGEVL